MTPDEARRRILAALKRFDEARAAEAKKRDGTKRKPKKGKGRDDA